jgi:hypothetical protein
MDDLSGLDWSSSGASNPPKQAPTPTYSFPTLRPTPPPGGSRTSTPASLSGLNLPPNSRSPKPISKPSTPANDSFASLLGAGANKAQTNLTLQERQRQLLDEKARQEAEQRKKQEAQYGHGTFWDGLGQKQNGNGSGSSPGSGAVTPIPPPGARKTTSGLSGAINKPFADLNAARISSRPETEDDILAGFNSAAPVDASSHFPPQHNFNSGRSTPAATQASRVPKDLPPASNNGGFDFDDDDDPFGLSKIAQKPTPSAGQPTSNGDDDDILGMLAKPVSEIPRPKPQAEPRKQKSSPLPQSRDQAPDDDHPQSKAVAELVDMGFPADKAADALAQTDTGMNVQAAVGVLLNQAHEEAKQKSRGRQDQTQHEPLPDRSQRPQKQGRTEPSTPSWMREEIADRSSSRNKDGRSPAGEKDVAQYAQDIGSTLFKSANSLWKTSQKKVQRAVADMQAESDGSQPKWMREALAQENANRERRQQPDKGRSAGKAPQKDVTDEAMMLESNAGRPQKPSRQAQTTSPFPDEKQRTRTPVNNMFQDGTSAQRDSPQKSMQQPGYRPPNKLTRQEVEAEATQFYVSASRRKGTTPKPAESPSTSSDLADRTRSPLTSPPIQSKNPFSPQKPKPTPPPTSSRASPAPIPTRPKAPPRQVPPTSSLALKSSSTHRQNGSEAFKRGDYSAAHTHYTSALQGLPSTHPVTIIIYCNRALTNIKVGDPRAALSDADTALSTIGASRGEGEKIPVGGPEADKEMKEFFGKALMRKAEALEHMEKWSEAAKAWKEAVEAGVGGAVSIQGRNRCEKAADGGASKPVSRPASRPVPAKKPPPPKQMRSALSDLSGTLQSSNGGDGEAVKKLREANAAAEKADDEKFALTDKVDAMLVTWKGSKSDNLRALLGSLDKVLWPEAGWTKVGMQDLVMANRVKIVYMKAIAKVHPDKVCSIVAIKHEHVS